MLKKILSVLPGDHPWQNTICIYDSLPSSNDLAKELANSGAPEGTVILARAQSAGRGRLGRSFYAPQDMGVYLSVILRPQCKPEKLMHLTCATAVAACQAVEDACGIRPRIKWTNDLVVEGKKLGGILTELSVNHKTGLVQWAVLGIGINCNQKLCDFPSELQAMATSLLEVKGSPVSPEKVAGELICALEKMNVSLQNKSQIMTQYRQDCMTVGKQVQLLRGEEKRYGKALDITEDGGLLVAFEDGQTQVVSSGEISVRGLYGYT